MTAADEKAVASFYERTTGTFCANIASTLALHPCAPEWSTLLTWTQSSEISGYAIADGFLALIDVSEGLSELKSKRRSLLNSMDEETRQNYDRMKEFLIMRSLATWELKNLAAGSDVMQAIVRLSTHPKFCWTICRDHTCESSNKHQRERDKVAKVVMRSDAENPPWDLNAKSLPPPTGLSFPHASTSAQVTSSMPPPALLIGSSWDAALPTPSMLPPTTVLQEPAPSADKMDARKKRKRDVCSLLSQFQGMPLDTALWKQGLFSMPPPDLPRLRPRLRSQIPSRKKGKGKQDVSDDEDNNDDEDDAKDPSYVETPDKAAQCIIQQVT